MKAVLVLAALLVLPAAAWAADDAAFRLYDAPVPAQQETPPERPPQVDSMGFMEYVYRYSQLDMGVLLTDWDSSLDLESDVGFYVRWGVGLTGDFSVTVAYRHYDFENSALPGLGEEDLLIRAVLFGLGWNREITPEFSFEAHAGIGPVWWDSQDVNLPNDTGPLVSFEGALTIRLHEMMRLRIGAVADIAVTEFHQDSSEAMISLSALLGFEIGL